MGLVSSWSKQLGMVVYLVRRHVLCLTSNARLASGRSGPVRRCITGTVMNLDSSPSAEMMTGRRKVASSGKTDCITALVQRARTLMVIGVVERTILLSVNLLPIPLGSDDRQEWIR